jgi:hypothetical protein
MTAEIVLFRSRRAAEAKTPSPDASEACDPLQALERLKAWMERRDAEGEAGRRLHLTFPAPR